MLFTACHLYLERIDAARNMARFYRLTVEPTLFGEVALVREWGRIGGAGRRMSLPFESEREAVAALLGTASAKRARGYRPRHSP